VTIYGDGAQTRDFTFVSDVVDAGLLAEAYAGPTPVVLNVAAGGSTSIDSLAGAIGEMLGMPIQRSHMAPRADEVRHSQADVSRSRMLLGFEAAVGLREGLARTAEALLAEARAPERAA
jgi:nucleoside-diphosphate-sugar epimerase